MNARERAEKLLNDPHKLFAMGVAAEQAIRDLLADLDKQNETDFNILFGDSFVCGNGVTHENKYHNTCIYCELDTARLQAAREAVKIAVKELWETGSRQDNEIDTHNDAITIVVDAIKRHFGIGEEE